jgi:hypothetical protein
MQQSLFCGLFVVKKPNALVRNRVLRGTTRVAETEGVSFGCSDGTVLPGTGRERQSERYRLRETYRERHSDIERERERRRERMRERERAREREREREREAYCE